MGENKSCLRCYKLFTLCFFVIVLVVFHNSRAYCGNNKIRYHDNKIDLSFPEEIGGFYYIAKDDYGDNKLGYSISYRGENRITVTIYIYDAGKYPVPVGIKDKKIKKHLEEVSGDVHTLKSQGVYKEVIIVQAPDLIKSLVDGYFLYSAFNLEYSNKKNIDFPSKWISYVLLRGYRGYYFKIRITYPDWPNKKREEMDIDVRKFLLALHDIMEIK